MRTIKEGKRIKRLSKNKTNFRIFLLFCFSIIGLTVGYSALNEEINYITKILNYQYFFKYF